MNPALLNKIHIINGEFPYHCQTLFTLNPVAKKSIRIWIHRFDCNEPAFLLCCGVFEKILESSKYYKGICKELGRVQSCVNLRLTATLTRRRSEDGATSSPAKYTG